MVCDQVSDENNVADKFDLIEFTFLATDIRYCVVCLSLCVTVLIDTFVSRANTI